MSSSDLVGKYGPVRITGGMHQGKFGYYDNESDSGDKAVVYLEGSDLLSGDYVLIPFSHLEAVDVASIGVERFKREHPKLAETAGL